MADNPTADPSPLSPPPHPLQHTNTFPHKTSAAVATRTPYIDTSRPAINAAPVELDGVATATSPISASPGGGAAGFGSGVGVESPKVKRVGTGGSRSGEEGIGEEALQRRNSLLASRSKDPSVIVDVPKDPTAEEVEAAKSAEGASTPLIGGDGKAS